MPTWNERFAAGEGSEKGPESAVVDAVSGLAPGRALDLACGLGRNAIYLQAQGWTVVAVDSSEVALAKLPKLANLESIHADLEAGDYFIEPNGFDLIIDSRFLYRPLFPSIVIAIKTGGRFVGIFPTSGVRPDYIIEVPELLSYFEGWEVLHLQDVSPLEIVLRKPVSCG